MTMTMVRGRPPRQAAAVACGAGVACFLLFLCVGDVRHSETARGVSSLVMSRRRRLQATTLAREAAHWTAPFKLFSPACDGFLAALGPEAGPHAGWLVCGARWTANEGGLSTFSAAPAESSMVAPPRAAPCPQGWVTLQIGGGSEARGLLAMRPADHEDRWVVLLVGRSDQTAAPGACLLWCPVPAPGSSSRAAEGLLPAHVHLRNACTDGYINVVGPSREVRGHGDGLSGSRGGAAPMSAASLLHATQSQAVPGTEQLRPPAGVPVRQVKLVRYYEPEERMYIARISKLPGSSEKRVISYGLYGGNPKYLVGAVRNAELAKVFFPGWTTRFYADDSVPRKYIEALEARGAEIVHMGPAGSSDGGGGGRRQHKTIEGMFWRFLVADDPTVDRYIVRDSDSRLNPRDRLAVEEWIQSGKGVHSVRDHPNHNRFLNGGLWGGVHGAIQDMAGKIRKWNDKARYGGDLKFLCQVIWPLVKSDQISHDAYTCTHYPNAHPFPSPRPGKYQHVGQVFDEQDQPRLGDIDKFMRDRLVPAPCRRKPQWKYG